MSKRSDGEGTIYRDKTGAWWAQLPAGPDGRRPRRKATTQAEARDKLQELRNERAAGRDLSRKSETIRELLDDALAAAAPQLRPASIIAWRTRANRIAKHIGAVKIDAATTELIQRFANTLSADVAPQTVRLTLSHLRAAFERVIPERLSRNPVDWRRLRLRRNTQTPRPALDDDQARTLLATADDVEQLGGEARYAIAWHLGLFLGLRRGEICAVSWRDLDWSKAELSIRHATAPDLDGWRTGPPKTESGKRTLPVPPALLERLRAHWDAQQAERKLYGPTWQEHGLIVCQENGTPISPNMLNRRFTALITLAGLPHATPHTLRRTFATNIDDEGFSEAIIAALLGHEHGRNVTRDYIRARFGALRRAVIAVENRVLDPGDIAKTEAV